MKKLHKNVAVALTCLPFLMGVKAKAEPMLINPPSLFDRDEFIRLHSNMEKAFDSFLGSFRQMPMPNMKVDSFKINISEDKEKIEVVSELAGMNKEDIDISLGEDFLTIKGEKKTENKEDKNNQYHLKEINYGSFSRTIILPAKVDIKNYTASFENGILKIILKKLEKNKDEKVTKVKLK